MFISERRAFANNLRDFESIRNFFTASTIATLVDLPFAALFFVIFSTHRCEKFANFLILFMVLEYVLRKQIISNFLIKMHVKT